jgi:lipopolysaccharide/colanic/teichoic acid biosynthesis glycosyltransferase
MRPSSREMTRRRPRARGTVAAASLGLPASSSTGVHKASPRYRRIKRALDLSVSVALLPVALAVLAVCAVAIRLESPGRILFVQDRTGRGGKRFRMYKLRTMVADAEARKAELAHRNELSYPDFKITDDPRITRVGRFLRKTSLDELPQIFNVIRGDMSLVGPRPTSFEAETYSLWHTERLEVKPGITGLWQVSGRSELDFDDRLRLDIAYVRNRSLRLDLNILIRTVGAVLTRRGAS